MVVPREEGWWLARGLTGGERQVRFEVALGGWVATGVWVERLGVGKRERQPERDSPPSYSVSEVRLPRVRVKRIFASYVCLHTGCPVLMCEPAHTSRPTDPLDGDAG